MITTQNALETIKNNGYFKEEEIENEAVSQPLLEISS